MAHTQEHTQEAPAPDGRRWADEIAAMAADQPAHGHERPTVKRAPFEHQVDIEAVESRELPEPPTTRGVVSEIFIEDQDGSASKYPEELVISALRGPAIFHEDLYKTLGRKTVRIFPVAWRGEKFMANVYWNELPAGVIDPQVEAGNAMLGIETDPDEIANDRLEMRVDVGQLVEPTSDQATIKALASAVAESIVAKLIPYMGEAAAKRHLTLIMQTDLGEDMRKVTATSTLGDLGIEGPDSELDHDRFIAFLKAAKEEVV